MRVLIIRQKLTVRFSESIDLTPPEDFEAGLDRFFIEVFLSVQYRLRSQDCCKHGRVDADEVVIQLLDAQRPLPSFDLRPGEVTGLRNVLVILAGGLRDVSRNRLETSLSCPFWDYEILWPHSSQGHF